jgi:hypothetical protein
LQDEHTPTGAILLLKNIRGQNGLFELLRVTLVALFCLGKIAEEPTHGGVGRLFRSALIEASRLILHRFRFLADGVER